jgi:excisionase family DNA binding protein
MSNACAPHEDALQVPRPADQEEDAGRSGAALPDDVVHATRHNTRATKEAVMSNSTHDYNGTLFNSRGIRHWTKLTAGHRSTITLARLDALVQNAKDKRVVHRIDPEHVAVRSNTIRKYNGKAFNPPRISNARDHGADQAEWLSIKDLAMYCGISERKLRELLHDDLPHVRLGRLVRVSRTLFDAWMRTKAVENAHEQPARSTTIPLLDRIRTSRPSRRFGIHLEEQRGPSSDGAHDRVVKFYRWRVAS